MELLSLDNICFELLGYPMSYVELVGTLTGLVSVALAMRAHIGTWPIGLVNIICFAAIFYQVNLYSDLLLQMYFFVTSIYGWYNWRSSNQSDSFIKTLTNRNRLALSVIMVASIIALGYCTSHFHIWLPKIFTQPASYPFADSFTTILSIVATLLLARRIIENWVLWILVDIVCIILYYQKGIYFISIEYAIFLMLATAGLLSWRKQQLYEKGTPAG